MQLCSTWIRLFRYPVLGPRICPGLGLGHCPGISPSQGPGLGPDVSLVYIIFSGQKIKGLSVPPRCILNARTVPPFNETHKN